MSFEGVQASSFFFFFTLKETWVSGKIQCRLLFFSFWRLMFSLRYDSVVLFEWVFSEIKYCFLNLL